MSKIKSFVIKQEIKETVSIKNLELAFNQAEKRLVETLQTCDRITLRNNVLVTIVASVAAAACAYLINKWSGYHAIDNKIWTSFFLVTYTLLLTVYMLPNIFPNGYSVTGSCPVDFVTDQYFLNSLTDEQKTIALLANEIEDYQKRIESNSDINNKRAWKYKMSVVALCLMPCLSALFYFALEAFTS